MFNTLTQLIEHSQKIKNRETPILLEDNSQPQGIIHLIPLSSFKSNAFMDIQGIELQNIVPDKFNHNHIFLKHRTNMDGKVFFPQDQPSRHFYVQVHRNGVLETVFCLQRSPEENNIIYRSKLKENLTSTLEKHLSFLDKKLFHPPILTVISFIKVKDYYLGEYDQFGRLETFSKMYDTKSDREDIRFEMMLERYEEQKDIIDQAVVFLDEAFNYPDKIKK